MCSVETGCLHLLSAQQQCFSSHTTACTLCSGAAKRLGVYRRVYAHARVAGLTHPGAGLLVTSAC
jgi:hypothetical protein